jgi:hypothetical protein
MNWQKSSYSSAQGNCVEVAPLPHAAAVRDSKDPSGPVLRFTADAWQAFLSAVKDGRL